MSVLASPMSTTSRPWAVTPSAKAAASSGDDGRMSWPTTTTPVSADSARSSRASAAPISRTSARVDLLADDPRTS